VKERVHIRGYVRYMDDMALWGSSRNELKQWLDVGQEFLGQELGLECKATPYLNRTNHGMDFLGCRVFSHHLVLNRRSRVRYARKVRRLEDQYQKGEINSLQFQQRATSLTAFTTAGQVSSWRFRKALLKRLQVGGLRPPTG
jgi:hypothetical protein